jgi:hypothetical protein
VLKELDGIERGEGRRILTRASSRRHGSVAEM